MTKRLLVALVAGLMVTPVLGQKKITRSGTLELMKRVADWQLVQWQERNMTYPAWGWVNAVGYTGIFALSQVARDTTYSGALYRIGSSLNWNTGPHKGMADDYCVAQTYAQLYTIYSEPLMIARFRAQADTICMSSHTESLVWKDNIQLREWAWCDALFMGAPALAYLSTVTGDRRYLDEADTLWWKTTAYLFDKGEDLFFRDSRYFEQREGNGEKVFWSRGNGWVLAGLARLLDNTPLNYADRPRLIKLYKRMSEKVAALQQPDGTWRTSLLNPRSFPNEETSGTALYCYALAWGIHHGILAREHFGHVVLKAWGALSDAVHPDGMLGFVQKIGDKPGLSDENSTEPYGTGALLLAGSEMLAIEQE